MRKHSEKFPLRGKKCLDAGDIQDTCIPISLQSTSAQEDCTVVKARSPKCRFSPCPETMSPIRSQTSLATLLRARSISIEDYTGKESIHLSTPHPPSRD